MRLPTFYEQNLIPNWGIISMTFGIIDAKVSDFFIYLHPENSFRRQYETYI